jgi:hypothetical protein
VYGEFVEVQISSGQKEPSNSRPKGKRRVAERSMALQQKPEIGRTNVVRFTNRRRAPIEPDLKKFLDECVIPILIRDALKEISLESVTHDAPHSNCGNDPAKPGVR